MECEVLLANECSEWEGGKGFGEQFEDSFGVFRFALSFEAIDSIHVIRLVITPVQEEGFRP